MVEIVQKNYLLSTDKKNMLRKRFLTLRSFVSKLFWDFHISLKRMCNVSGNFVLLHTGENSWPVCYVTSKRRKSPRLIAQTSRSVMTKRIPTDINNRSNKISFDSKNTPESVKFLMNARKAAALS